MKSKESTVSLFRTKMCSLLLKIILLVALTAMSSASFNDNKEEIDCPVNEEFYKCSLAKCPSSCHHLVSPKACPLLSEDCYKPACECIYGYLRNEDGKCVPEKNCFDSDKSHRVKKEAPESAEWEYIEL